MLIYDADFAWEGWGGKLQLASGKCRLRIFDRARGVGKGVAFLRPFVVMVSDLPDSKMTVRSCAGHIATRVTETFAIDPQRMVWVEYYPAVTYGPNGEHTIDEQYVSVDFEWYKGKAINPRWRQLTPPLLDIIRDLAENPFN